MVPATYASLLRAVAGGCTRLNEIAQRAGVEPTTAGKYLTVLRDVALVRREVAFFDRAPERSRRGLYVIQAEDSRGRLLVGECKWTRAPVGRDALAQFQSRAANHALFAKRRPQLLHFARAGFTPGAVRFALEAGMHLISLRNMLAR